MRVKIFKDGFGFGIRYTKPFGLGWSAYFAITFAFWELVISKKP